MDVDQIMKNFISFINEARFKEAKRLIRKYSRNRGDELGKKLFYLGFFYGTAENYELTIFCLKLSQRISKNAQVRREARKYLAIAHALLGSRFTNEGLFNQAETHYKIAISLRPDFSHFHNNYAILLRKRGCFGEAKKQYEIALRLKPDDHEVHHNYAILLIRMGDLEEAEQHLEKSLHKTDYFPAQLTYSLVLISKSRFVEAENLLGVLLESHPEDPRIFGNLGIAVFAQGILDRSEECLSKAKYLFTEEGSTLYAIVAEGYLHWIKATKIWASGDLRTSSQLFVSASEKFSQSGFEVQSLIMALLSQLILFDRGLTDALKSRTLVEFRDSITRIYHEMEYIFENARTPKLPPLQILSCKFKYIEMLFIALQFGDYDIVELEKCRKVFHQFGFKKDVQSINSLDNFLQSLNDYKNLVEIPLEKQEELLRMIQPFYVLNEMITKELSRTAQYEMSTPPKLWLEKMSSMEEKMSSMEEKMNAIIDLVQVQHKELINQLLELNEQQLIRFQELVEETIQDEIDKIEDHEKKERIKTSWGQWRKTASITVNLVGFVASVIQIYLFINDGRMDLAYNQVKSLLTNLLGIIH